MQDDGTLYFDDDDDDDDDDDYRDRDRDRVVMLSCCHVVMSSNSGLRVAP